ncbi:thioesterase II family protein [Desulfosporosinus shakirovi]|uniref:thioesterase II family protein n=1 Tax=Desulfosporosinus shakirovi TaxID=2885154 RepID=UPI001E2B2ADB|nr:thioesterase domain-containing protein [Desulfosporosinus sp. SRJS8]MCB8816718.1 hypothetical protein [Desulfosporosinus sp. SRJS8]
MPSKWIKSTKKIKNAEAKLFCLPFAGAGAMAYANWHRYFGWDVEVCPILLPGRESRISEPLIADAAEIAEEIYHGIQSELGEHFYIFGHSMGGIIAYELSQIIKWHENRYPEILFMSATTLKMPPKEKNIYEYSEEELARHLANSGGTYAELLENREFRECYFPIIRNDYKLSETYISTVPKIGCKIHAFASKEDREIGYEQTLRLADYTDDFEITFFQGDHFYVKSSEEEICRKVYELIRSSRPAAESAK